MSTPQAQPIAEDDLVAQQTRLAAAFCLTLVVILLVAVFLLAPDRSVRPLGLAVGAALGVAAWGVPLVALGGALRRVPRPSTASAGLIDPAQRAGLATATFLGLALAEAPALLAVALLFVPPVDAGVVLVAVPAAIGSIWLTVAGPGATRRHLERLRD